MKIFDDTTEVYNNLTSLKKGINTVSYHITSNKIEDIKGIHFYVTPVVIEELGDILSDEESTIVEILSNVPVVWFKEVIATKDGIVVMGNYYNDQAKEIVREINKKIKKILN